MTTSSASAGALLLGALAVVLFGAVSVLAIPLAVRLLPEPEYDEQEAEDFGETEPKELYADIARLPRLGAIGGVAAGLVLAALIWRLGWSWELLALAPFVPAAVALFVVDVRTRYLPTWLIGPFYGWVLVVGVLASVERGTWTPLLGELVGWLVLGGFFTVVWLLLPEGGLGYGDVRLAGLLGLALGLVSWGAVAVGMATAILVAGLVSVVVLAFRRRGVHIAYGPYLLVGGLAGAMYGQAFATSYLG